MVIHSGKQSEIFGVRKDRFEKLDEFLRNFSEGDSFVMESTGFYEIVEPFIGSKGFNVNLANLLKIMLIA